MRPLGDLAAAAFLAGNDYSAQTTFKRGDATTTPNLDAALESVSEARSALRALLDLID